MLPFFLCSVWHVFLRGIVNNAMVFHLGLCFGTCGTAVTATKQVAFKSAACCAVISSYISNVQQVVQVPKREAFYNPPVTKKLLVIRILIKVTVKISAAVIPIHITVHGAGGATAFAVVFIYPAAF